MHDELGQVQVLILPGHAFESLQNGEISRRPKVSPLLLEHQAEVRQVGHVVAGAAEDHRREVQAEESFFVVLAFH